MLASMAKRKMVRKYFYTYTALHEQLLKKLGKRGTDLSKWVRQKSQEELDKDTQ